MPKQLTSEEEFIVERIETSSSTGRIIIPGRIIEKYRDMIGDHSSPNWQIKNDMILKYSEWI